MFTGTSRAIIAVCETVATWLTGAGNPEMANGMKLAVLESLSPEGRVTDADVQRYIDTVADINRDVPSETVTFPT
jgi:hypothetical protein